jgi:hypothetical protein
MKNEFETGLSRWTKFYTLLSKTVVICLAVFLKLLAFYSDPLQKLEIIQPVSHFSR